MGQVTISGGTYDVYGDSDGLKAYLAGKLGPLAYDTAESAERKKAHVSATRWIDRESWQGELVDGVTPQPLAWPRTGVTCDGDEVSSGSVPENIIDATYELAEILLADPAAADAASQGTNVKSVGAGSAKVAFFRPGSADGSGGAGGIFPVQAQKLVRCLLDAATGVPGSTPVATGTARGNQICESDFTLKEGMA